MIVAASTGRRILQKLPNILSLQKMWMSDSNLQDIEWLMALAANMPAFTFFNASNNEITKMRAL
jgi:hypothetical protein